MDSKGGAVNEKPSGAMDSITARATSPDGMIMARLSGRRSVRIAFRSGSFARYQAAELEHQLGALLNTVWTAHGSAVGRALAAAGATVVDGRDLWHAQRRRYHGELDRQVVRGKSSGDCVGVRSVHRTGFAVRLRPRLLESIDETRFVAEIDSALMNWGAEERRAVNALKRKYFADARIGKVTIHSACEKPETRIGQRK